MSPAERTAAKTALAQKNIRLATIRQQLLEGKLSEPREATHAGETVTIKFLQEHTFSDGRVMTHNEARNIWVDATHNEFIRLKDEVAALEKALV